MTDTITIGRGTYHAGDLVVRRWHDSEGVTIGKYGSIADRVQIFCGGGHRTSLVSTWPFDPKMRGTDDISSRTYKKAKPTIIGHDVWIASGATIMPGLTIGNGAVIGPMAVVFEDVEPYSVVRGNPAKHVRYRMTHEQIATMQRIAWWDWEPALIRERLEDFYAPVEQFLEKYG